MGEEDAGDARSGGGGLPVRAVVGSVAVLAACGLAAIFWWQLDRSRSPPVVRPPRLDLLDPAVRRLIEEKMDAVEERPGDPAARADLGLAYEANRLWSEARASFSQALALDRENPDWRYHLAVTAVGEGDVEAGARLLEEIPRGTTAFAAARQRLGLLYLELGDFETALEAFERVQETAPDRAAGFVGAAEALLRSGRPEEAAPLLERALILEPDHAGARYRMGLIHRSRGAEADARRELGRGVAAELRHLPAPLDSRLRRYAVSLPGRIDRAEALRQAGRHEDAARLLERARRDHPENVTLMNNLARSHLDRGDLQQARDVLRRATETGGDWETRAILASLELADDRPDRALEEARRAVAAAPQMALPHSLEAQALVALGRYREAAESMEEVLRREVRDHRAYLGLGVLYEGLGRWREAFRLYHRAVDRWPDLVPALVGLAEASWRLGEAETAAETLDRIRTLAPDHPRRAELEARIGNSGTGRP